MPIDRTGNVDFGYPLGRKGIYRPCVNSGGSERANYSLFLSELTEVLGLEKPNPSTQMSENDHYRLERPVKFVTPGTYSTGWICR
ncbi:MAG: hypothetical protein COB40_08175 [Marinosulfonomonas sp.]|nr:MAG: hypothetical protein COB40_08175 [Marinosulfonomonas sp.]